MPIVAFLLILAGAAVIFVLYPHLRLIAGAVVIVFGAIFAYLAVTESLGLRDATPALTAEALELSDLDLTAGTRFQKLTGRVVNHSATATLRSFEVRVQVLDCPDAESPDDACAIIADDIGLARVSIPPGQTRDFEATLGFSGHTAPKGVSRWIHTIGEVTAAP